MPEYSNAEIKAVLNNPNDFPPRKVSQMLLAGCFSVDDLKSHGLASNQASLLEKALLAHNEEENYKKCTLPNPSYDDLVFFLDHYPASIHYKEVKSKKDIMDIDRKKYEKLSIDIRENDKGYKEKLLLINQFLETNPFSAFINEVDKLKEEIEKDERERVDLEREKIEKAEKEAAALREQEEKRRKDEEAWRRLLSILSDPHYADDIDMKLKMLNDYESQFSLHKHEISQKKEEVIKDRDALPQIQGVINDPSSDVIDYLNLIKEFPFKKEYIREFMFSDMALNPSRYDREEMNWLLRGKYDDVDKIPPVFTTNELLARDIAPLSVLNHIVTHPRDTDDRDQTENRLVPEENFKSKENNTDIYFFGCPGSGKSAVLAGLFKATVCDNLRFNLLMHGGHLGYTYASILKNYLTNKLFPQPTKTKILRRQLSDGNPFATRDSDSSVYEGINQGDEVDTDKFIQIVDAKLIETNPKTDNEEVHYLSIIEMPGERTLDFAVATNKDPREMDKLLGVGTKELFMNNNRKVFFIVLDPNPQKAYTIKPNGVETIVTQKDVLEALVEFFSNVPGLLEKIDAIHIILAKSDLLTNADNLDCIQEEVINKGYEGVLGGLKSLCKKSKGNVNAQCGHSPYLFTFSLGKVYPGHMLEYNDEDAKKILQLIAANTYSIRTTPTKWETIVNWMNQ